MTPDREKLREDVARVLGVTHRGMDLVDAAIALIWPAAMRKAEALVRRSAITTDTTGVVFLGDVEFIADSISLLSPDAEKEEGR